jgi:hypothetical protein
MPMDFSSLFPFQGSNNNNNYGIPTIGGMSNSVDTTGIQAEMDSLGQTLTSIGLTAKKGVDAINPANAVAAVKSGWQANINSYAIYGVLLLIIIIAILGLVLPHQNE